MVSALGEDHRGGFKALTWTPSRAAAKQKVLGVLPRPLATRLAFDLSLAVAAWAWWSQSVDAAQPASSSMAHETGFPFVPISYWLL